MERQAHSRFAYLLEPIRDLTKNWEVDVAGQLDEYLSEIAEIRISFDGGATSLNFAEAALLIQGSTCIYSRKVEYLHALVYQTLDLISSKRKLAHGSSVDDQGRDTDVSIRRAEEPLVLDDLPGGANLDLVEKNMDSDSMHMPSTSVPRTPLSLIPLQASERTNSTPLLSHTGELLGSKVDFKMNTGYVHSSGALVLEPLSQQTVITVTRRGGADPITITSTTPAAAVTSMLCGSAVVNGTDMDTSDAGPAVLDDSGVLCEDLGASPALGPATTTTDRQSQHKNSMRKKCTTVIEKKFIDPLRPLDPHSDINDCKPLKRGVTHRCPAALKDTSRAVGDSSRRVGRKRSIESSVLKEEPLATFIRNSLYSCSSLFPKMYYRAPASAEFEGLYWEEQKRLKEQRVLDNKRMRALRSYNSTAKVIVGEQDTYQPLGQEDVSDEEDVQLPSTTAVPDDDHFEAAFERLHDAAPSSFQGVEPMALEEGSEVLATPSRSHTRCNYEDLVREYVESTTAAAAVYANETDLSKRVLEWETKIKPILDAEELHPVFDIHLCGSCVIDTFKENDSTFMDFHQLAKGREHYEISRLFSATLQLANDGSVEISPVKSMDAIGLKLLSTHTNFHAVGSYKAYLSHK